MTPQTQIDGLTTAEVDAKHAAGQTNHVPRSTSRPVSQILRANIFTLFNAILTVAVVVVLALGDWRDAVFGLVMILNAVIGIFSELRSKRTLDSVAVLESPQSTVWRNGQIVKIHSDDLVEGDAVELSLGDQVPADGTILVSRGLEIDESILTGESRPVRKQNGDSAMSGSAVVAGSGVMVTERIGMDSWAQKMTAEAKKFSLATSEIQQSINVVLKWITWALPLVVALLIWSQLRVDGNDWRLAIILAVAGVVGMIPQGLVLLTSMNFGLAAATLARRGVLVQELPAVEILARVDQLCLDKTGTITTGGIRGKEIIWAPDATDKEDPTNALWLLSSGDTNATATAVHALLGDTKPVDGAAWEEVPFSSSRKWSAIRADGRGTWVFGAPEILLQASGEEAGTWAAEVVAHSSESGQRSLCLAYSVSLAADDTALPDGLKASAIIVLEEDIRADAAATLAYFKEQGVTVRVISGDAPATVAAIAASVGLQNEEGGNPIVIDARTLPPVDSADFGPAARGIQVFGRVTPEQKKALVQSLQADGGTVAMTGDGVNDAMALKQADLGIAMGSGAPATKAVSRLVLLNGEFSVLPGVVAEGRRIIANMERVSALFLSKTTYAMLLAILVSIFAWSYPFLPRHLTYIGWFTIGIPGFFLALAPNKRLYKPGFLRRTLSVAVPSGLIIGVAALGAYLSIGDGDALGHTAATLTTITAGLWLLTLTARPLVTWRVGLVIAMAAGAILGVLAPPVRDFFALEWPTGREWAIILGFGIAACILIEISFRLTARIRNDA